MPNKKKKVMLHIRGLKKIVLANYKIFLLTYFSTKVITTLFTQLGKLEIDPSSILDPLSMIEKGNLVKDTR